MCQKCACVESIFTLTHPVRRRAKNVSVLTSLSLTFEGNQTMFLHAAVQMIGRGLVKHVNTLHTSCGRLTTDKVLLMKLRKSTGYSFINCKNALEKFNNDITQVNSETDFVARNKIFQQLVTNAALTALDHHQNIIDTQGYTKHELSTQDLLKLSMNKGSSLAELLALTIGCLGENLSVRRAVCLTVPPDWLIGTYVHGEVGCAQADIDMGRYGALVVFQGECSLGRKLAQHVVGEAPITLGNMEEQSCSQSETRFLSQTLLWEPSLTVSQFLRQQNAQVFDFMRFQCGEGRA
ncbi:elongation factor Ts, mitochondrial isoform X2 [Denticeps clupeoides]|uniref:elongation factor Ts, mitochondrial-like isoform X2 n=1 Tax=Denticeps clupeoides TaxID=299321 RepID=UPI0010A3FA8A|nr:elongation factor Ts, mitochondrial-like isoform X2 [Denticeps clupeoides]XP_028823072.1 elongation factor Ts, mitochondrial-like isoform X2 [Denticeps clupeoides]